MQFSFADLKCSKLKVCNNRDYVLLIWEVAFGGGMTYVIIHKIHACLCCELRDVVLVRTWHSP